MKEEYIGKVKLNLEKYPGEDFYCDGVIEDRLLEIARDHEASEYPEIIARENSWEVFYHFSEKRQNIIEWIPIEKDAKVLEVGSGCGAITGMLSEKAGSVSCVELSKKRSSINAWRNRDAENVEIFVGNFEDIEPDLPEDYDYIFLIGVYEYSQAYIHAEDPYDEFLRILKKHLAPEGRIVIAIENRMGLKYFAGCREDHLGTYFEGLEDYPNGGVVRTFSKHSLEERLKKNSISDYSFYYPYPDYKFATQIFSDNFLPSEGMLYDNIRNFDRSRMLLFDENRVYDSVVRDGYFPDFSNSFLLILGKDVDVEYAKYSNDRAPEYSIVTEMVRDDSKIAGRVVVKRALTDAAQEHVRKLADTDKKLSEIYKGSFEINHAAVYKKYGRASAEFDYLKGVSLNNLLHECRKRGDKDGFFSLLDEFVHRMDAGRNAEISNLDMAFSNVIITGEDRDIWNIIDYEWITTERISVKMILFRALYCWYLEDRSATEEFYKAALQRFGFASEKEAELAANEAAFQKKVSGGLPSLSDICFSLGQYVYDVKKYGEDIKEIPSALCQIYFDRGAGYSEADSVFPVEKELEGDEKNLFMLSFDAGADVKAFRFDPAMQPCLVRMIKVTGVQREHSELGSLISANNGIAVDDNVFVFDNGDPNISFSIEAFRSRGDMDIQLVYERELLSDDIAKLLANKLKKKKGLFGG